MMLCIKDHVISNGRLTDKLKRALKGAFVALNLPGVSRKKTKTQTAGVLAKVLTWHFLHTSLEHYCCVQLFGPL
jgi:hypothetical protein